MCPDIVETKLLTQRQREWQPDPQVINKWSVLYNLQKDYMERMKPKIEGMKNYDQVLSQKLKKEKAERENLSNLIQFQNKVNNDLRKKSEGDNKFDKDEDCEDEDYSYNQNKITAANKNSGHLSDFNKVLVKKLKDENNNIKKSLTPSHKNKLEESMKSFFNKNSEQNIQGDSDLNSSDINSEASSNMKSTSSDSSSIFNSKINLNLNTSMNPNNYPYLPVPSPITQVIHPDIPHVVHQTIPQPIALPSLQVTPSPDELINLNLVHHPPVVYSQIVDDPLKSFADMGKKILEMDGEDIDKKEKSEKSKDNTEGQDKKEEKDVKKNKEEDEKIKKEKKKKKKVKIDKNVNPDSSGGSDISETSTTDRKISIEATIKNPGKNGNELKKIINETINEIPEAVTKIHTVIDENKNKSNLSKIIKSNSSKKENEKINSSSQKAPEINSVPISPVKVESEKIKTYTPKEDKPNPETTLVKPNEQATQMKPPILSGKIKQPTIEIESFLQKSETKQLPKDEITKLSSKLEDSKNSIFDEITSAEEVLDTEEDPIDKLNEKILNPPPMASFLETSEFIHFSKDLFESLIAKSTNFNLETQRRGRRRSRFPDPQWDCAESQISKLVMYLCEEEISASYQKYCKPIFEQINTMVESFLYHDNNLEICQNLHLCPVTSDIK